MITGLQVHLPYVSRDRTATTRTINPLGLAAKGSVWYLLANTDAGLRTFGVDRMTVREGTGEPLARPPGFVLAEAWSLIADEVNERRLLLRAQVLVDANYLGVVRGMLRNRIRIGAAQPDGRIEVEIRGHSVESLSGDLAGFGNMVKVVGPPELCARLFRVANELLELG